MNNNRRSQQNKRNRQQETAQYLLDSFHWQKEEQRMLELLATGFLDVEEVRKLGWGDFREGGSCIFIGSREIPLEKGIIDDLVLCRSSGVNFSGEEILGPGHKIFSSETGKEIRRLIDTTKLPGKKKRRF